MAVQTQVAQLQQQRSQQSERLDRTQQECARLQHLLDIQAQVLQAPLTSSCPLPCSGSSAAV